MTAILPMQTSEDRRRHGGLRRRAAIVGAAPIFRRRTGSAAYLASFCDILREMGFRVDVIFLDGIPREQVQLRLHQEYLRNADEVALCGALRFGSRFVARRPEQWSRRTLGGLAAMLKGSNNRMSDPLQPPDAWRLAWPDEESLTWARRRLAAIKPEIVVANYFNASRVFQHVGPTCLKAILVHDVFALRKQSYDTSGYPLDFDVGMIADEAEAFASADLCITIKPEDAEFIRTRHPNVPAVVFPHVLDVPAMQRRGDPGSCCLFVGSNNEPNRRGLAWLLEEVWPQVIRHAPDLRLRVVGNIAAGDEFREVPGVDFAGVVDNLADEYFGARAAVVPLRAGSGLKIKLVEALGHGVPVVSTSVGAEGVESASPIFLRVHDEAEAFAKAIVAVADGPGWNARSAAAYAFARANYSKESALTTLAHALRVPFVVREDSHHAA